MQEGAAGKGQEGGERAYLQHKCTGKAQDQGLEQERLGKNPYPASPYEWNRTEEKEVAVNWR